MAIRKIRENGDEILRKKAKLVEKIDEKICQLLDDMSETMYKYDGVGLAAPQIGILKRIVVIDVGDGIIELINPEIIEQSGKITYKEGCLSVPNVYGNVIRPEKVKVRALNRLGEEVSYEAKENFAQAICHELDHLEGVLFIDKATNLERIEEE